MRKRFIVLISAAIGVFAGARMQEAAMEAEGNVASMPLQLQAKTWQSRRFQDLMDKIEVPCPERALKVLVLGQSNAANTVGERIPATGQQAFEWWRGKCYRASSPMLGGEGTGGSIWPLVGDLLQQPVIFVVAAVGSTSSADWRDQIGPGLYLDQIETPANVTHIVWMQGEADADVQVAQADYLGNMRQVIDSLRNRHPNASIHVSQTTLCGRTASNAVKAAQAGLVDPKQRVFAGPDTDQTFGDSHRYDGCHLSGAGARKVAADWARSIAAGPLPAGR